MLLIWAASPPKSTTNSSIPYSRYYILEWVPESAINQAARTLLDLRETWESTTKEERKDLVHVMLQGVGIDVVAKRILWAKARPDYEQLFSILDGLRPDGERRYWIEGLEA